ncbi:hypothetical protein FGO68_gene14034 [Halteria grandinella]|uniref:Uncharacterized protein n=1 Tax=Halteria grandinella TaxID=5974 RepID=A0A8J8P106_HALGN|nr:hypothetical protein FGO68_gene14034 [Halteria grandinella]
MTPFKSQIKSQFCQWKNLANACLMCQSRKRGKLFPCQWLPTLQFSQQIKKSVVSVIQVETLRGIHQLGFVHCDIKPNNIMLRQNVKWDDLYTLPESIDHNSNAQAPSIRQAGSQSPIYHATRGKEYVSNATQRQYQPESCIEQPQNYSFPASPSGRYAANGEKGGKGLITQAITNQPNVYIVDFGLCCNFLTSSGDHIEPGRVSGRVGNMHFMSVNHIQYQRKCCFTLQCFIYLGQSRRDDLESLFYNLVYLAKGRFPWFQEGKNASFVKSPQQLQQRKQYARIEEIVRQKQSIQTEDLFIGMPTEFCTAFDYIRQLEFEEDPDYDLIMSYLKKGVRHLRIQREPSLGVIARPEQQPIPSEKRVSVTANQQAQAPREQSKLGNTIDQFQIIHRVQGLPSYKAKEREVQYQSELASHREASQNQQAQQVDKSYGEISDVDHQLHPIIKEQLEIPKKQSPNLKSSQNASKAKRKVQAVRGDEEQKNAAENIQSGRATTTGKFSTQMGGGAPLIVPRKKAVNQQIRSGRNLELSGMPQLKDIKVAQKKNSDKFKLPITPKEGSSSPNHSIDKRIFVRSNLLQLNYNQSGSLSPAGNNNLSICGGGAKGEVFSSGGRFQQYFLAKIVEIQRRPNWQKRQKDAVQTSSNNDVANTHRQQAVNNPSQRFIIKQGSGKSLLNNSREGSISNSNRNENSSLPQSMVQLDAQKSLASKSRSRRRLQEQNNAQNGGDTNANQLTFPVKKRRTSKWNVPDMTEQNNQVEIQKKDAILMPAFGVAIGSQGPHITLGSGNAVGVDFQIQQAHPQMRTEGLCDKQTKSKMVEEGKKSTERKLNSRNQNSDLLFKSRKSKGKKAYPLSGQPQLASNLEGKKQVAKQTSAKQVEEKDKQQIQRDITFDDCEDEILFQDTDEFPDRSPQQYTFDAKNNVLKFICNRVILTSQMKSQPLLKAWQPVHSRKLINLDGTVESRHYARSLSTHRVIK